MCQSAGWIFLLKMCASLWDGPELQDTLEQGVPLKLRKNWGQENRQAAAAFSLRADAVFCRHLKEFLTSDWMMLLWQGSLLGVN
jgi:hypothetical protein